jgi:uncharacterized protein Smg (DUF494 family)
MSKIIFYPGSSFLCHKHLKPVYDEQLSSIGFQLELLKIFMLDERIIDFTDRHTSPIAAKAYNDALAVYSPVCCFLGDEKVSGVYQVLRNIKKNPQ